MKNSSEDDPYPHKFQVEISLTEFIERYNSIEDGKILEDTNVTVAGMLYHIFII